MVENTFSRQLLYAAIMLIILGVTSAVSAQVKDSVAGQPVSESSTVVYGVEYFKDFKNIINAKDLVDRIPGTGAILRRGQDNNSRGFGSNDDGVLINGKRLSGKSSESDDVLQRIRADQVERIEIIRGSSPDVKVSSQGALVNVVLKEGVRGGSGTWEAKTHITENGRMRLGGEVSYSNKQGNFEYSLQALHNPYIFDIEADILISDGDENPKIREIEAADHYWRNNEISGDIAYSFDNGDLLRLNGLLSHRRWERPWQGQTFNIDQAGIQSLQGNRMQFNGNRNFNYEIGGDYEHAFNNKLTGKIIGLYNKADRLRRNNEDALIDEANPVLDYSSDFERISTEAIIRPTITYALRDGLSLEIGDEVAFNKVDTDLAYSENTNGFLSPVALEGQNLRISELRSETFANLSWKINPKWHIDSSLTYGYSRIKQRALDGTVPSRSQTFKFLKPTADIRYDVDDRNQYQFSVRRNVAQLDFSDFAATISEDETVTGSNANLAPEKSWQIEGSFEHRFKGDAGNITLRINREFISDAISRIEVSPGVAGVGNVGNAKVKEYELSGSYKFNDGFLSGVTIEGSVIYHDSNVRDAFTGRKHRLNDRQDVEGEITIQKDDDARGLSYGVAFEIEGVEDYHDLTERYHHPRRPIWVDPFIKYRLAGNMTLNVDFENIFNETQVRERSIYSPNIIIGDLSSFEERGINWSRRIRMSLQGTF